jgi:hypothetical protein
LSHPNYTASPPAPSGDRSIKASRAARNEKYNRERRIVNYLNAGVSTAEMAAREGLTHRRMRAVVQETLAKRMPGPPAEFLATQIGRLNEALLISYSALSPRNLRAVECYVKIVRELDRYHGLAAPEPPAHASQPRLAAPEPPLLLEAPNAAPAGNGAATD